MLTLLVNIIAAALIGYGMGSWSVGFGVALLAISFHLHFNIALQTTHLNIIENMGKVYRMLKEG